MCAPVVCSQFVISIEFKIVQSDCGTNLGSTWYPRLISGFFSKSIGFAQLNFGLSNSPHQAHPPGMNVYKQSHVLLKILGILQRKLKSSQSCTQTDFDLRPLPFIAAAGVSNLSYCYNCFQSCLIKQWNKLDKNKAFTFYKQKLQVFLAE